MKWNFVRVLAAALVLLSLPSYAAAPGLLRYQGFLLGEDNQPISELRSFTFLIFDDPVEGEMLFKESQAVQPVDGVFSLVIGNQPGNPLNVKIAEGRKLWLEVRIQKSGSPAVPMIPRMQLADNPVVVYSPGSDSASTATDALSVGTVSAEDFIDQETLQNGYLTNTNLIELLAGLSYFPGEEYSDARLQAYIDQTGVIPHENYNEAKLKSYLDGNAYAPGPYFSGKYSDLAGTPNFSTYMTRDQLTGYAKDTDLAAYATKPDITAYLMNAGIYLLADGTVSLKGKLDMANKELVRAVVHRAAAAAAPASPKAGQLWYNTTDSSLNLYAAGKWKKLGSVDATDVQCNACIKPENAGFNFAASSAKGGAAASAMDILCEGCIGETELGVSWAVGDMAGGKATAAKDVTCTGCVASAQLDKNDFNSRHMAYDNSTTDLVGGTVQDALDELAISGPGGIQEGNGAMVAYTGDWAMKANTSQTQFLHLLNPGSTKVISYLYGRNSMPATSAASATVSTDTPVNVYVPNAVGTKLQTTLNVSDGTRFTAGDYILIYQTIGSGGTGVSAGTWELNRVRLINGNALTLYAPLKSDYFDSGPTAGQSQVVIARSYKTLTVNSGGVIRPSATLDVDGNAGGIVYVRADEIIINNGGSIHANGYGFDTADAINLTGDSQCNASNINQRAANCAGGGGAVTTSSCGGGGGGNMTEGKPGYNCNAAQYGFGGKTWGAAKAALLSMGGGGGNTSASFNSGTAGNGGGIVVIGSRKLTVNSGGRISADGNPGNANYCGGGAGGTVAVFADEYVNNGIIQAKGGQGNKSGSYYGGDGGDGWVFTLPTIAGIVDSAVPYGIEIHIDGVNVTSTVGDPNKKGSPNWDSANKKWGMAGTQPWSSGALDLSSAITWTLGEHRMDIVETGGSGGNLKMYTYVVYPFSKAQVPPNNTCTNPQVLDVMGGPVNVTGTTEDVMGRIRATDSTSQPGCGGSGGPDVVYKFTLTDWKHLNINLTSPFTPRLYIRKDDCQTGQAVACGQASLVPPDLKTGTYYLFVDGDSNTQKGNFSLSVTASAPSAPANDTCLTPETLTFDANGVVERYGVTLFATHNYAGGCGDADSKAPDNVYKFTVPEGMLSFSVEVTATFNAIFYIGRDSCTSYLTCSPNKTYEMGWPTAGVYYLIIDGKSTIDKGEYTLKVTLKK